MPFWMSLYLLALVTLTAWSIYDDVRGGQPFRWALLDVGTTAGLVFLVTGYYWPRLVEPWGRGTAALYVAALLGTGLGAQHDIAQLQRDPELSQRTQHVLEFVGIGLSVALLAPALGFGALTALRAW
jgi:hypothetical protein